MSSRRELNAEQYLALLLRRRWLLLIAAAIGTAAGLVVAVVVPPRYTSHTMVLVEEPIIPDSYVKPVVSEDVNQRLASMQGQILSRTRLQHLIEQLNPYKNDEGRVPMEVMIDRLRKSVKVAPLSPMPGTLSRELPGFTIDVTLGDAHLAQQICTEITSMFMNQNIQLRQQQSQDTTQFLAKQLEEAKVKLDEQDAKLAAFQSRHIGALPEDEKTNVTMLAGMTPQLEAVTQGLNQARQEKAFAESLLNQQLAALKSTADGLNSQTLDQQLKDLQSQLVSLQRNYTDKHPSVVKVKHEIAQLEKQIQEMPAKEQSVAADQKPRVSSSETPQVQQLRAQLHQLEIQISQKTKEQEDLQRQIRVLQARMELSPGIQQELKELTRDYQTALNFYDDLLKKRNESQMATELENRQQSEKFRVLDPPSMPERPSFPNRRLFGFGGLFAGLALGVGIVHFLEARDKSIRTREDIEVYLGVPTLAVISHSDNARKVHGWAHARIHSGRGHFGLSALAGKRRNV